jgi:hypothetical protein
MRRGRGFIIILFCTTVTTWSTGLMPSAAAPPAPIACGTVINDSVRLAGDIGPCPGHGLIIAASNITVDLGGHTVTGSTESNTERREQIGVLLRQVTNVAVRNGTVQHFDAGLSIEGGGHNRVQGLKAVHNVNHSATTGADNPCNYGDGLVIFNSDRNTVAGILAEDNGPFAGVSIVGDSDGNVVRNNRIVDNNRANVLPSGEPGPCGPVFGGGGIQPGPGRPHQDIGIRVEGPGADDNLVANNLVADNQLSGIAVFGHVCKPVPGWGGGGPQPPNLHNIITHNTVTGNGFSDIREGIAIWGQGFLGADACPATNSTVTHNTSSNNASDGIFVHSMSTDNLINFNKVTNNGRDGIHLRGPFVGPDPNRIETTHPGAHDNTLFGNMGSGNARFDAFDGNGDCGFNRWIQNRFESASPSCESRPGKGLNPHVTSAVSDEGGVPSRGRRR